jgi:hypothetical protein
MGNICSTNGETSTKPATFHKNTQTSSKLFENDLIRNSISRKHSAILTFFISKLKKHHKASLDIFFSIWKNFHELEISELPENEDLEGYEEEDPEVKLDKNNLVEAKDRINLENQQALKDCPLFPYVSKENLEKPLPVSFLFRFFEEMMDKKYEADVASLQVNRALTSIPEFFLDHLNRAYGLKKLAHKAMLQILKTIEILYSEGNSYVKVICRLLQIYDPQPLPIQLAWFLTKARVELNKILTSRKVTAKLKRSEEVHLIDAVNLVYSLFENDKFSRAKAVSLMKPKILNDEEFLEFKISNKLTRIGFTSEGLFMVLDNDMTGQVSFKTLIEFLKKNAEMILNELDVNVLKNNLDPKNYGFIAKDLFLAKFQVKSSADYQKNELLLVSKAMFLSTLIEVYKTIRLKDTAFLTFLFKQYKKTKISQTDFKEILLKLDNRLLNEQISDLYEESLIYNTDYSLDGVLLDSLIRTVFHYAIGRRGVRDFGNI